MLFIAAEGRSFFVNLETKTIHRTCTTSRVERRGLSYCKASRTVAAHQIRGCASFFSPAMQQPLQRCFTPETVSASTCTSDGMFLVVGSGEGNVYLWNAISGQLLRFVRGHARRVTDITISSDNSLIATASDDSLCKTWSLSSMLARGGATPAPRTVFNGHTLAVNACAFLVNNRSVVTASSDRSCRIFDGLTGQQQFTVTLCDVLTTVRPSPSNELLLLGSESGYLFFVGLYTTCKGQQLPITCASKCTDTVITCRPFIGGHEGPIIFIEFDVAQPGYALVGSENGVILRWNTFSATPAGSAVPDMSNKITSICYVPAEAISGNTSPVPCAPLQKHPLDPSTTNFMLDLAYSQHKQSPSSTTINAVSRRQSCQREVSLLGERSSEEECYTMENKVDTPESKRWADSHAAEVKRLREKNDELEILRDKMKAKLMKLKA
ncbi:hypothetical protein TRVL_03248 [Trypanosoma vivax]|uniref:Uncharacterized protein n=1 Tax=Trypanosoma vivax (strain Y486) TaxID=1055687 RepID=G0TQZ2_TRYVY|nr:hypothetical protein TRVL_03248 [Trypanosoma vivax]CCC46355.1 conserved hypothetical protein [Trypanosoma vivax Y486]